MKEAEKERREDVQGGRRTSWRRLSIVICSLLVATGLLAACGGSDDSGSTSADDSGSTSAESTGGGGGESTSGDITYGFSLPLGEVPVAATVKSMVKEAAEAKGWSVLLDQTTHANIQEQTSTLETWITQGIDAITILPPEPSAFETMAKRATGDGIIWTTYAEKMTEGAGGAIFPAALSGKITGEAVVKWINANDPEAEVLVLTQEAPSIEDRTNVPIEMIEKETKAKIVAEQDANEQATGLQTTETVLQAHPDISVVVGISDDAALGAAEAFRKAGSKDPSEVFIIGQDGSEDALKALEDPQSYMRATAALDLAGLAEETVEVAARAIENEWKPGDEQEYVELAPTLIENGDTKLIKQFLATFES